MKAKKNLALVAAGIVIGAFLAFPTAHAAEELFTAVRSSHQFFLDGEKVQMEAYIINGNNYVKLADVGKMVGFNVYWDGAVYMDSDAPYTGKAPEASSTLEEVREEIAVLVNEVRRENGLQELTIDQRLMAAARTAAIKSLPGITRKKSVKRWRHLDIPMASAQISPYSQVRQ